MCIRDSIINKGEKLPCSVTKDYVTVSDGQTSINCTVNESNVEETDPDFVKRIWEGNLDLPEGRPAGQKVQVTFSYDENQTMKCSFLDISSNKKTEIDLTINNKSSKSEVNIDDFKVE